MYQFLELALFRSYTELKAETKRSYAGFLWWLIRPFLSFLTFWFVFGVIFKAREENFLQFLFIGIIVWQWFSSAVMRCANSIISGKPLMQLVKLNPAMFSVSICLIDMVKFFIGLLVFFVALLCMGDSIGWAILYLPVIIISQLLLCIGFGLIFSSITPFLPDLELILNTILQFWMYLSCVMYSPKMLPAKIQPYININPMTVVIEQYRDVILHNRLPNMNWSIYLWVLSLVLILIGSTLTKKFSNTYLKRW